MGKILRVIDAAASSDKCWNAVCYYEDTPFNFVFKNIAPQPGDLIEISGDAKECLIIGENATLVARAELWPPADNDGLRWRLPISHDNPITRMEVLRRRHVIRSAARAYLDNQGFIEIDAPLIINGAPPEIALDTFFVEGHYLITSTEYQLKRLAIGGVNRLYSLTKNFRNGDESTCRNPEFTMLEWQRVGETMKEIENDTEAIAIHALEALKSPLDIVYQGVPLNMKAPWKKTPVFDEVERLTGYAMKDFELDDCYKAAVAAGINISDDWKENKEFLFSILMDTLQPQIGIGAPVFLTEWPLYQTTTSASVPGKPEIAQRSQLFMAGVEVADGFADLSDADQQLRLFNEANKLRVREGKEAVKLDGNYLKSMRLGCAYGAAMAMGFDRLVMILTNQKEIKTTLAFDWTEI
ncbi:MAG: hypothetical protein FWF23_00950 [Alphaproteobacteria bacterium]|nr:hypothetical protein [Alphaproteobacteria bacterium]MCL2505032.1 hypothetical protein [Alphaproteobacteria bacterium]